MALDVDDTPIEFDCPRCGVSVAERFYGPCRSCVAQLAASQRSAGGDYAAAEYEPKMNVTPNQIASKD
ncbi:MAG: hypothetical protein AAGF02_18825 [Actinomycetota bacterium]